MLVNKRFSESVDKALEHISLLTEKDNLTIDEIGMLKYKDIELNANNRQIQKIVKLTRDHCPIFIATKNLNESKVINLTEFKD